MGLLIWSTCLSLDGPHGVGDAILELYDLDLVGVVPPFGLNGKYKVFGRFLRVFVVIGEVNIWETIIMAVRWAVHGGCSQVFDTDRMVGNDVLSLITSSAGE
jgi:hypothetical protein